MAEKQANPFFSLFPSQQQADAFKSAINQEISQGELTKQRQSETSLLLERIFLITTNKDFLDEPTDSTEFAIYLGNGDQVPHMEISDVGNILLDRLLLEDLPSNLLTRKGKVTLQKPADALESNPLLYLFACYDRSQTLIHNTDELESIAVQCTEIIVGHLALCFLQQEMFADNIVQNMHLTLFRILQQNCRMPATGFAQCIHSLSKFLLRESQAEVEKVFVPVFRLLVKSIIDPEVSIADPDLKDCLNTLLLLTGAEEICQVLLSFRYQASPLSLISMDMNTMLGLLLGKSCLITDPTSNSHAFFADVADLRQSAADQEEERIHAALDEFHGHLRNIFYNLIRYESTQDKLLTWIGVILYQNSAAGKLWMHENTNPLKSVFRSDAVFLNLSAVLCRLSIPFCLPSSKSADKSENKDKFLKIDPTYCMQASPEERLRRGIHIQDLHKETCIVSVESEQVSPSKLTLPPSFKFITKCFFMTHASLHLGMHGLLVKFYQLNKELNRLRNTLHDVMAMEGNSDLFNMAKNAFERAMAVYLTTKASLCEPTFVDSLMRFTATTARYLIQLSMTDDRSKAVEFELPLDDKTPESLKLLPEYLVENLSDFLVFLKRFSPGDLEKEESYLHIFLSLITVYMGNKTRMSNPHLRASLADVLEFVLPQSDDVDYDDVMMGISDVTFKRKSLESFGHVGHLTISSLQLFVDIEFTGDPHAFEQKFNYRRPLYQILKLLWKDKRGREAVRNGAMDAVANMDSLQPPLLLRFINLLLNDAIFLLDEAIDYLTQIKTMEGERDSGSWNELPNKEKQEKEGMLKQLTQIARFHNVMSNETIDAISYMSSDEQLRTLLSQEALIDRIAGMLNSFLLRLVGPRMGQLKVRDFAECEFKPKQLVLGICTIYVNLGSRSEFPPAVAKDVQSYRPDLFPRAIRVLRRLNHHDLCLKLKPLSEEIRECQNRAETEEEMFQDAPDEFFDPVMSTLMHNPVLLPTSNVTVDRSTIARHLLSDTTDPFNRQPLALEDVVENTELAERIAAWMKERRK